MFIRPLATELEAAHQLIACFGEASVVRSGNQSVQKRHNPDALRKHCEVLRNPVLERRQNVGSYVFFDSARGSYVLIFSQMPQLYFLFSQMQ
jgi:hypothetical protein